jgi:hypothetical protein
LFSRFRLSNQVCNGLWKGSYLQGLARSCVSSLFLVNPKYSPVFIVNS